MGSVRRVGRVAVAAWAATIGVWSTPAKAAEMSLTIAGIAAPVAVTTFSIGASRPSPTKVSYLEAAFSATESAASALQLLWTSEGRNVTSAQLRVLSPVTAALKSEWTFSPIVFRELSVSHTFDPAATTRDTTFSFSYGKLVYRVFADDGSVQSCFDSSSSVPC